MKNIIEVNKGPVLTFNMRIATLIIAVFGIWTIYFNVYSIPALIIGAIFIVTGVAFYLMYYKFEIDPNNKKYQDYIAILSYRTGKPVKYNSIEKIFINKINRVSNFTSRGRSLDIHDFIYKAFIKFDSGEKLNMDNDSNKEKLLARVNSYANKLETIVLDNTQ